MIEAIYETSYLWSDASKADAANFQAAGIQVGAPLVRPRKDYCRRHFPHSMSFPGTTRSKWLVYTL